MPTGEERTASFLLQLVHTGSDGSPGGDPAYGVQLQTSAVPGVAAEGRVRIETAPLVRTFADGTEVTLRAPTYHVDDLAYGELDPATVLSPRLAPAMIGLGLLESIDEAAILARADPDDADGDGLSGRANREPLPDGGSALGRFGHKAGKSSLIRQNAHALHDDMGLSTFLKPDPDGDCTDAQPVCETLANGVQAHLGEHEVPDELLELVTFYSANLAVPARADVDDPDVLAGKALFAQAGCVGCHVPRHVTSRDAAQPEHRFQLIWPYTDLLLHDMGDELADGRRRSSRRRPRVAHRPRSGASARRGRSTRARASCTTGARRRRWRRCCGTAARRAPRARPCSPSTPTSAPRSSGSSTRCSREDDR